MDNELHALNAERDKRELRSNSAVERLVMHHIVVHCKKCWSNLTDAKRWAGLYGCDKCNAWTNNVEVKDVTDNLGPVHIAGA